MELSPECRRRVSYLLIQGRNDVIKHATDLGYVQKLCIVSHYGADDTDDDMTRALSQMHSLRTLRLIDVNASFPFASLPVSVTALRLSSSFLCGTEHLDIAHLVQLRTFTIDVDSFQRTTLRGISYSDALSGFLRRIDKIVPLLIERRVDVAFDIQLRNRLDRAGHQSCGDIMISIFNRLNANGCISRFTLHMFVQWTDQ